MDQAWTTDQVLALAPDASSAQAGRGLSSPGKWVSTGRDDRSLWGECQGSGSKPYQVSIDMAGPAFHCSCPSHKFPCKHGLGLLLMLAAQPAAIAAGAPPAWVVEWLAKRDDKAQKRAEPTAPPVKDETALAREQADQARRAAQREKRVADGLAELDLWLRDLVRQGLAQAQSRPARFWEEPAARMVDAQAPGVARMLREMAGIPASGEGWMGRLLERIGLLYLLMEGYGRLDSLPEGAQADVRAAIGWTVRQEEVLAGPGVRDTWRVLGQRVYDEDGLRVQRTWLRGDRTARAALVLSFSRAGQPIDASLLPGSRFEGELAFFPGTHPLRAAVKLPGPLAPLDVLPGHPTAEAMLSAYADALAGNPWIEAFPAPLAGVVPARLGSDARPRWTVRDPVGAVLPLACSDGNGWRLLAVSGGRPVDLFGEWDGARLLPLALWAEGRYVPLGG